jgi:hypothetical protein
MQRALLVQLRMTRRKTWRLPIPWQGELLLSDEFWQAYESLPDHHKQLLRASWKTFFCAAAQCTFPHAEESQTMLRDEAAQARRMLQSSYSAFDPAARLLGLEGEQLFLDCLIMVGSDIYSRMTAATGRGRVNKGFLEVVTAKFGPENPKEQLIHAVRASLSGEAGTSTYNSARIEVT